MNEISVRFSKFGICISKSDTENTDLKYVPNTHAIYVLSVIKGPVDH